MALPSGFVGYTPGQAAKLTGLTFRIVDHYDRSGLISPSVKQSGGRGVVRAYSFEDLVALKVVAELRSNGITVQAVRKVVEYLRNRDGKKSPLSSTLLVTDGVDVYEARNDDELLSLLKRQGQGTFKFTVDLKKTIDELNVRITDTKKAA